MDNFRQVMIAISKGLLHWHDTQPAKRNRVKTYLDKNGDIGPNVNYNTIDK
jgi:hypothetical protein